VPQRWFNGFPPSGDPDRPEAAPLGSLLIHFASNRDGRRPERMVRWSEIARNDTNEWKVSLNGTRYYSEIREYWQRVLRGEGEESICKDIEWNAWN
jgi:hypothetical protein